MPLSARSLHAFRVAGDTSLLQQFKNIQLRSRLGFLNKSVCKARFMLLRHADAVGTAQGLRRH